MRWKASPDSLLGLLIETGRRLFDHRVIEMSAALAFYAALSLAPLVVISLGVAGLIADRQLLELHVASEAESVLGVDAAELIRGLAKVEREQGGGLVATIVGSIAFLFASTAVFGQLQEGLDRIWHVKVHPRGGLWLYLRKRLLSLAMVASLGFLLLVSMLVSATLSAFTDRLPPDEGSIGALAHITASVIVAGLLFALVFRVLPAAHVGWSESLAGGALTSVLFHVGEWGIGQYLGRASIGSPYGAAGTLVVLLVWVYYSSVIVFAGAEFTHVATQRRRARQRGAASPSAPAK